MRWRKVVETTLTEYCEKHKPCSQPQHHRSTCRDQESLTGASSGWHPPKSQRFIRRVTFRKMIRLRWHVSTSVIRLCLPSPIRMTKGSAPDNLDPRCTECWLKFLIRPAGLTSLVVTMWTSPRSPLQRSSTSTCKCRSSIQRTTLQPRSTVPRKRDRRTSDLIFKSIESDGGYISAALLARFDAGATFPRLPFEPISENTWSCKLK